MAAISIAQLKKVLQLLFRLNFIFSWENTGKEKRMALGLVGEGEREGDIYIYINR